MGLLMSSQVLETALLVVLAAAKERKRNSGSRGFTQTGHKVKGKLIGSWTLVRRINVSQF
jgi:hypothetical protein